MNKALKNIILLLATLVTIACIIIGTTIHVGVRGFGNWWGWIGNMAEDAGEISLSKDVYVDQDIDSFENVKIKLNLADIKVVKGEKNHLKVEANKEKAVPEFEIKGKTLKLEQKGLHAGNNNNNVNVAIVLTVSDDIDVLDGQVDLGDFTLDGVDVSKFDVDLNLGSMKLYNSKIDDLEAKLDLGDVKLEDVDFMKAELKNNLGDIDVTLPFSVEECSLDLNVSLGDLKVNNTDQGNRLKVKRGDRELVADCDLGDIKVND